MTPSAGPGDMWLHGFGVECNGDPCKWGLNVLSAGEGFEEVPLGGYGT